MSDETIIQRVVQDPADAMETVKNMEMPADGHLQFNIPIASEEERLHLLKELNGAVDDE